MGCHNGSRRPGNPGVHAFESRPGHGPLAAQGSRAKSTVQGSAFASGLLTRALHRIEVNGASATPAEHWTVGFRVRDVAQAPDGALWLIEDDRKGGLYRLTPK